MEQGAPEPRRHFPSGPFLWVAFFLFVIYPLSTGPVFRLFPRPSGPLIAIYKPLALLCESFPPAETFFDWYIATLWGVN